MPNPNEIQRLTEELEEHRNVMRNLKRPKKDREYHLSEINRICRILGEDVPGYNSGEFSSWLREEDAFLEKNPISNKSEGN